MVGTEKTADYKSAGTTQLLDETTIAKNEIGRLQICRDNITIGRNNLLFRRICNPTGNRQIANLPKHDNGESAEKTVKNKNRQITNLPKQRKE